MSALAKPVKSALHSKRTSIEIPSMSEGKIGKPNNTQRAAQKSPVKMFGSVSHKAQGPRLSVKRNMPGFLSPKQTLSNPLGKSPLIPYSKQSQESASDGAVVIQSIEQLVGILGKSFKFGGQ